MGANMKAPDTAPDIPAVSTTGARIIKALVGIALFLRTLAQLSAEPGDTHLDGNALHHYRELHGGIR